MTEIVFLVVLALVWLIFASIQDLKKREVANWLNFSLIIFALGFRIFHSLFTNDFNFLYQGLFGLAVFFAIGNFLYYGRMFAGGDAKLMIALGAIIPFSESFSTNSILFASFFLVFMFVGGFYGMGWSLYLPFNNIKGYKEDFSRLFKQNRRINLFLMFVGILIMALGFYESSLFYIGIFFFVLPYLYVHARAVDESCLVREVKPNELVEGDWLFKSIKIGNKTIKAKWEGLTEEQIKAIKKRKNKVKIRQGIPFVPVFLMSFLIMLYFYNYESMESIIRGFFLATTIFP